MVSQSPPTASAAPCDAAGCADVAATPIRRFLSELRAGDYATLAAAELPCEDCDLLNALGMTDRCRFKVCKAGDPWIVQVNSTRIGLSKAVARRIVVQAEARR